MSLKMRAAIIRGPRDLSMDEVAVPNPGTGEVRFKVKGCGVSAASLAYWQGAPWTAYPIRAGRLGNEAWGVVESVGSGVTGVRVGQTVAAISKNGFADYDIAPVHGIVPLPDSLSE